MNVTKRTESIYEIEFDPSEIEALEYFKQMYNITAEMLIDMSLENSFNEGLNNSENTIRRIEKEMNEEDGNNNSSTD